MKSQICWFMAFVFLVIAAVTGLLVGIGAIKPEWFCATIFSIIAMFSSAEYAEVFDKEY